MSAPKLFVNGIEILDDQVVRAEIHCDDGGREVLRGCFGKPVTMGVDATFFITDEVLAPKPWPDDHERRRNGWPKCEDFSPLKELYGSPRTSWMRASDRLGGFTLDRATLRRWKGRKR